jgi:hypothetical protein
MPYSFQLHTATAGQQNFSFSQIDGFVTTADLQVFVNGTLQSTSGVYTINTTTVNIQFITGRTVGDIVLIRRFTAALKADREVDFDDGSILTASDLDNSALQLLYLVQEGLDEAKEFCLRLNSNLTHWDAVNKKITNLATPTVSTDAATKGYVDAAAFGSISGGANLVFATPNGSAGFVTLRALVADDVPRLNEIRVPTGSVSMNSQKITNVLNPTAAQDAATKNYCDINFVDPNPQIFTSTFSGGSYSNTSSVVTQVGTGGLVRVRLNLSVLPVRKVCLVEGLVGPFDGSNNSGPHWFSMFNSTGSPITVRIERARFNWLANIIPALGFNIQSPEEWDSVFQAKGDPAHNPSGTIGPFTNVSVDGTGMFTVGSGADWKFYREDGNVFWNGSYAAGNGEATGGSIGPAVGGTTFNGFPQGTYARIAMEIIRMS